MQKPKYTLFGGAACLALVVTFVITATQSARSAGPEPVPVSSQGNGKRPVDVNVVNSPTVHLAPGGKVGIAPGH